MTDPTHDPKQTDPGRGPGDLQAAIRGKASTFRWVGIALILVGALAVLFPHVASVAAKAMLGWFLIVAGAVVLWHAFQARDWRPAALSGLVGVLHLALGVYLAFFPLTGLVGLTVFLAILFLVQGVIEVALAWQHRPGQGAEGSAWVWMGASGAVSGLLGLLLLAGLPGTALWALGLIVGINFITSGAAFLMLSGTARRI